MAVDDHGDLGVMVLEPGEHFFPEFPSVVRVSAMRMTGDREPCRCVSIPGSHVAIVESEGKVEVYTGHLRRDDCRSGAALQVEELSWAKM